MYEILTIKEMLTIPFLSKYPKNVQYNIKSQVNKQIYFFLWDVDFDLIMVSHWLKWW